MNDQGAGVAHCFRCGLVETLQGFDSRYGDGTMTRSKHFPGKILHESMSCFGRDLWASCKALEGVALDYLLARNCVIPPQDGHLRYHPALRHPVSGITGPALVALVSHATTGLPLTLHRTWIQADGHKAMVAPPRMFLGGHRKAGGVVRLWPDDAVTLGLGIAEGIETALSLAHAFTPVWACLDANNLATLSVPMGVESLLIAADNDQVGIDAARTCGVRWSEAGREVRIATPDGDGADLNDLASAI